MSVPKLPYSEGYYLVKDADVLLFRCPVFPQVGWWIGKYSRSVYSHAALAYWHNGELYCLEFREFIGSRMILLKNYTPCTFDVFRALDSVKYEYIVKDENYKVCPYYTKSSSIDLNQTRKQKICEHALSLLGNKYDWWTILQLVKRYIPFYRMFVGEPENKDDSDPTGFVCSTLITFLYRKYYIDPVPCLPDNLTQPSDLAKSFLFNRILTLKIV